MPNPVSPASTAQDSRGLLTWRRNTAIHGEARGFPRSLIARCAPAIPAKPGSAGRSDTAVVPPRPTIMPHNHRLAMPQVTAVDGQFGTHTVQRRRPSGAASDTPTPGQCFATPTNAPATADAEIRTWRRRMITGHPTVDRPRSCWVSCRSRSQRLVVSGWRFGSLFID